MSEQQGEPRWLVTIKSVRGQLITFTVPDSDLGEMVHPLYDHTWELVEVRPDPDGPPHPE